jgi:hypothetical protein
MLKYKKLINLYLAFGTTLNYQKHVSENLTLEELKAQLPDSNLFKPKFRFINSQYKYNNSRDRDMDMDSNNSNNGETVVEGID